MRVRRRLPALLVGLALLGATGPAAAEVHFGNNVFIGGHNFSHQSYNHRHRLHVTLYDRPIHGAGCAMRADGHGGTVRRCQLRRIRH